LVLEPPISIHSCNLDQRLDLDRSLRLGEVPRVRYQAIRVHQIERDEHCLQELAREIDIAVPLAQGDERHVILKRHLSNEGSSIARESGGDFRMTFRFFGLLAIVALDDQLPHTQLLGLPVVAAPARRA
jgi:hypothetical protein